MIDISDGAIIICTYHVKSEVYIYEESETSFIKPLIHYFCDYNDEVKYLKIKNKLKNNLKIDHHEIQYLVLSPFMIKSKIRPHKVRDVCALIEQIKINKLFDDEEMYLPLILAINQYISDENEKRKLIEVLTMDMPADEIYEKVMSSGIYEQGLEQGVEKGAFEMALKIKDEFGVEEAARISGFSIGELENEVLDE